MPITALSACLDQTGKRISLATFKSAEGIKLGKVLKIIEQYNKSVEIDTFAVLGELLRDGKTLRLVDSQMPFAIRLFFNRQLRGNSALVTPVKVAGKAYGLLGFVWSKESKFEDHDAALVEGIADQIGTALERDQLSTEVMRLKSELHHVKARSSDKRRQFAAPSSLALTSRTRTRPFLSSANRAPAKS